jgi:uncharacterized Zn finger protein (UPF0148 family)
MLSYYEDQLIGESRRDPAARCLRCNSPLLANFALKGEGLCPACAEGKTIQWTPPADRSKRSRQTGTPASFKSKLRRLAGAASRTSRGKPARSTELSHAPDKATQRAGRRQTGVELR